MSNNYENIEILAKGNKANNTKVRLSRHIEDLLIAFSKLEKLIPKELTIPTKISIIFHDIGKVLPSFQAKIGNKEYLEAFKDSEITSADIPHSIFSTFFINLDTQNAKEIIDTPEKYKYPILSAIAYHHWREETFNEYIKYNDKMKRQLSKISKEQIEKLKEYILKELELISLEDVKTFTGLVGLNERMFKGIMNGNTFSTYIEAPYSQYSSKLILSNIESLKAQKEYIMISGVLQRCDHFASWVEENQDDNIENVEIPPLSKEEVTKTVEEAIKEKNKGSNIWQITKVEEAKNKRITFLVAPTGIGKTEFAFLWGSGTKTLYTLPMKAIVNQIHQRATKVFKTENTGILHSDADIYLMEKQNFTDVESIKVYEMSKNLSFPFIVMTGDQIFPYVLRFPGYEKVMSVLSYSNLVIDEVQSYDPKALAVVVKSVETTYALGGNVLLMTATLPDFVKEEIKKRIKGYKANKDSDITEINLYEENKENLKKIKKHLLELRTIEANNEKEESIPTEELEKVISEAQSGKRVLVVVNTVKTSQDIFKKIKELINNKNLKEIKTFLIHSKFTIKDREEKERSLLNEFGNPKPSDEKQGKILVSTQVIEVSMDLDADVIFTEICPIDALIQRIGRVARRYYYIDGKIFDKSTGEFKDLTNFKAYEENKPNVFVWIRKDTNAYESGKGKVYNKELIEESIKILSGIQDDKIDLEYINGKTLELDEYEKYELSNLFYEKVIKPKDEKEESKGKSKTKDSEQKDKNKSYITEFYETLQILDIGYSEKNRKSAQEFFREETVVPAAIEEQINEFKNEIKRFIANLKDENISYLKFKSEVLSKFLVNIEFFTYYRKNKLKPIKSTSILQELFDDETFEGKNKIKGKIERWIQDIFVLGVEYDPNYGILDNKETKEPTENNII
jgi:CRISPR-associated endonuclease/helicase Cas3